MSILSLHQQHDAPQVLLPPQVQDGQPASSAAMCFSPLCLQASPFSATGHLRILLNDGPFRKQPSHCMHCRQKWVIGAKLHSCMVWLQHHMTSCSSMTQLRTVGGRQGSWPRAGAHMPETRRSASCFKFFCHFSSELWCPAWLQVYITEHMYMYGTWWSTCDKGSDNILLYIYRNNSNKNIQWHHTCGLLLRNQVNEWCHWLWGLGMGTEVDIPLCRCAYIIKLHKLWSLLKGSDECQFHKDSKM